MPEETIVDLMMGCARDAVDMAQKLYQTNLDFSENSISNVEDMLERIYQAKPKGFLSALLRTRPSDEKVRAMSNIWGGYVGEVIRRRWGGEWTTETPALPGKIVTLRVAGEDIFPPAKV